jgi:hypothetical protein
MNLKRRLAKLERLVAASAPATELVLQASPRPTVEQVAALRHLWVMVQRGQGEPAPFADREGSDYRAAFWQWFRHQGAAWPKWAREAVFEVAWPCDAQGQPLPRQAGEALLRHGGPSSEATAATSASCRRARTARQPSNGPSTAQSGDTARSWPSWAQAEWERLHGRPQTLRTELLVDPLAVFRKAELVPDAWQERILRSVEAKILILAARQVGKSLCCAALALGTMLLEAPALVLVVSPSDRQSAEFVRKAKSFYHRLQGPVPKAIRNSALELQLDNGSRLVGLPDSEGRIRGYSDVKLLFLEEAARVPDALYHACTPMLAVSHGRQVALSTAFARQGWYFDAWQRDPDWYKESITAEQCPRLSPAFLAAQRQAMPERWFEREFRNAFLDPLDSIFRSEDIEAMVQAEARSPLPVW